MLSKSDIRNIMLKKRSDLSNEVVLCSGEQLLKRLLNLTEFAKAKTVFIYVSAKNEVSTFQVIDYLLKKGICVCVPKTLDNRNMIAIQIKSTRNDLLPGMFGIPEPITEESIDINEIDLAVIPGVAFGVNGSRIGYGAGYYDIFLSDSGNNIFKVGVCYDFQVVELLPEEKNDVKMDCIVEVNSI